MKDDEKILNALDKIQGEIDSLKQELQPQAKNQINNQDFKTIVRRVDGSNKGENHDLAMLDGNIETI